jgi:hypothetical protein
MLLRWKPQGIVSGQNRRMGCAIAVLLSCLMGFHGIVSAQQTSLSEQNSESTAGLRAEKGVGQTDDQPLKAPRVSRRPLPAAGGAPVNRRAGVQATGDKSVSGTSVGDRSVGRQGSGAQVQGILSSTPSTRGGTSSNPKIEIGLPVPAENAGSPLVDRLPAGQPLVASSTSSLRGNLPLQMRAPKLEVTVDGPSHVAIGQPQNYQLLVRNEDSIGAEGLVLRLIIPPGVSASEQRVSQGLIHIDRPAEGGALLTWAFDHLGSGASANLSVQLTAQSSADFNLGAEWTLQPIMGKAAVQVLCPDLELELTGPTEVEFSQPSTYTLRVTNPGSADALDVAVQLTAEKFGSSATQIGSVAAGSTEVIDVELVFNEKGPIKVVAEATAVGGLEARSEVTVQVRKPELEMVLEAPESVYYGSAAPYCLRITNFGDTTARQVQARLTLPDGAQVLELPEAVVWEDEKLVWTLKELSANTTEELTIHVELQNEGENLLLAECTSDQTHIVRSNATTSLIGVVDLRLSVSPPTAPAPVGSEVAYELTLSNRGSKIAEGVSVIALFSKDIEPTRAEGQDAEIIPGQVRFAPLERLMPGESIQLTVFAEAETDGMHRFRAEVNTPNAEVKLAQEETTHYIQVIRRVGSSSDKPILR